MSYNTNTYRLPDPSINPQAPGFSVVGLKDESPGVRSRLNNGGAISIDFAGNYWIFELGYTEMLPEKFNMIYPFISYAHSKKDPIYIQLPQYVHPKSGEWSVSSSIMRAEGDISIGDTANEIIVTDWDSRGGDLDTGDMLRFTNSEKVYQVVMKDVSEGDAKILLHCPVIEKDKIETAGLYPNDIKFRVDVTEVSDSELSSRGVYEPFSLTCEENIL